MLPQAHKWKAKMIADQQARERLKSRKGDDTMNQIDVLANFIMAEVDGEPSRSEGAGDCAIRIIRQLEAEIERLKERSVLIEAENKKVKAAHLSALDMAADVIRRVAARDAEIERLKEEREQLKARISERLGAILKKIEEADDEL